MTPGVRLMRPSIAGGVSSGNGRLGVYRDENDVDAATAELLPKRRAVGVRPHGPAIWYCQREHCMAAREGDLVVFGQAIANQGSGESC
jgi:hypothetical protein